MAKGSMKDIESSVSDAIDNDGSTPDPVDDHDDARGDNTYGTTATPSNSSQGVQTQMLRNAIERARNGQATDDDYDMMHSMVSAQSGSTGPGQNKGYRNGSSGIGGYNTQDEDEQRQDGSTGRGIPPKAR